MMELTQNMIELVKEVKTNQNGEDEIVTETYWSSPFLSTELTYIANDIAEEFQRVEDEGGGLEEERKAIDRLMAFLAESVYDNKFTKEEMKKGIHGPNLYSVLQEQLIFMTRGQQSEDTKKFLAKKG